MITGRTTLYRGIKMRSRLEADFARFLDQGSGKWQYEPECFADETGQYLPDFLIESGVAVTTADGTSAPLRPLYVDVKPLSFSYTEGIALSKRMEIIWSTYPDVALQVSWREYGVDKNRASLFTFGKGHTWDYWTPETGIKLVGA